MYSRNKKSLQLCRYLVLNDQFWPRYWCTIVLVVLLIVVVAGIEVVLFFRFHSLHNFLHKHILCYFKFVSHKLNMPCCQNVCKYRPTNINSYTHNTGIMRCASVPYLMRSITKCTATVMSYHDINITLTQSHVPSLPTQLQSCHVI